MRDRPFEYTFGCFKGCLCILIAGVLSIVVVEHIGGCLSQMKKKNAALSAISILATNDKELSQKLKDFRQNQTDTVLKIEL